MKINKIRAREILDSRGEPTVEVKVDLDDGKFGIAKVPSGASTGEHEALELRDNDKKRYGGKGVMRACKNVNDIISERLVGMDVFKQEKIDRTLIALDGTPNKSKLGANAILGVSLACCVAAANSKEIELYQYIGEIFGNNNFVLPQAYFNIINGGKHADSGLDVQEFMIVPKAINFFEKVRVGSEVFHALKDILQRREYSVGVGDEGGFAPKLDSNEDAIETILRAIEEAGYKPGADVNIALDVAASSFYNKEKGYCLNSGKCIESDHLIAMFSDWISKYPIKMIEDLLAEDDWEGWKKATEKLGDKVQIVGDDLFVTNIERVKKGIKENCANSVLIKLNQIGTLTETFECIKLAKSKGYATMISHRSGETIDTFIADLCVGTNSAQIKSGSLSRGERVCKYNRLMEIEELLK
ncbi:MAG: phosphopyruvate hydratase [Patescibacteria group bacterium]|jgi:enolase